MSDNDDPFADLDDGQRTIIVKPQPGGPSGLAGLAASRSPALPPAAKIVLPERGGLNPLETSAAKLLSVLVGLKNTHSHPDVAGLHRQLISEMRAFETRTRQLGVGDQLTLNRASYVLCATLDDVILNTPWGQEFGWSKRTLQGTFFGKEWAGDEFFQLLEKLLGDPVLHRDLLELMYVCLALGFKGGYRVYDRHDELEHRREQVYRALRNLGDDFEPTLSPHWRGIRDRQNAIIRYVPLWVLASGCALLLLLIYLFFYFRLTSISEPVFADTLGIGTQLQIPGAPSLTLTDPVSEIAEALPPPPEPTPPTAIHSTLRNALKSEPCLQSGDVTYTGQPGDSIGTFIRTGPQCGALFASGKWDITPQFEEQLVRIGKILKAALDDAPGWIIVTGHTDNVPGKYISNIELSQRRAQAALAILSGPTGNPSKIRAEGQADNQPLPNADNATKEGRAKNRRVEVMLLFPHISL